MKSRAERAAAPPTPETVIRARRLRLNQKSDVAAFFGKLIVLAAVLYGMFAVLFGVVPMRSNDMKPTLSAGDLLLFYRLADDFHAGDIVVFDEGDERRVGRVAAVGGDTVEVTEDSALRINGSYMIETDIYYPTPRYGDEVSYPLTLEEGEYFILCDLRDGGRDSRYFGPVPAERMLGRGIAAARRSL